ncbi:uncharacterized protein K452DRAFT_154326 [Aplosporella prunicola CBS 121167]|uniref:Uncharacterized protein n=1 Tax=Aplosporella prunicola CBS 121167 TaxID=1176127 RepID=A0A6A6BJH2_9PEZI|nr:uncharacterized protein K452DRAFT_154326 [Aplosporella prunicola CBS 121167]KAF2144176.1 hypothetical protein K452DRAFT_154326 [Aplosporella prunicola CBS 121167]
MMREGWREKTEKRETREERKEKRYAGSPHCCCCYKRRSVCLSLIVTAYLPHLTSHHFNDLTYPNTPSNTHARTASFPCHVMTSVPDADGISRLVNQSV